MKTKSIMKIIAVIIIALTLFTVMQPIVNAANNMVTAKDLKNKIEYGDSTDLQTKAGRVMGIIRNIAVILGVIMLMIIGVKYITGSAEEKADYKKSLIPLVVGIIVVMSATQIATMVMDTIGD